MNFWHSGSSSPLKTTHSSRAFLIDWNYGCKARDVSAVGGRPSRARFDLRVQNLYEQFSTT
eukprot:Nitzschia sp. Nitz4//scaffold22_size323478//183299//183765//NITZ4_000548-RA/size323478-snap-gene-0.557-mRNA-1//-1//CDS//3329543058//8110//frame0